VPRPCEIKLAGPQQRRRRRLKRLEITSHFHFNITRLQPNNELHLNLNLTHPGSYLSSVWSLQAKFIVPSRSSRWRTNLQSLLDGKLLDNGEGSIEEETCLLPPNSRHYPCRKRSHCKCSMFSLFSPVFCEIMARCGP
jgi:hypothetical protein